LLHVANKTTLFM